MDAESVKPLLRPYSHLSGLYWYKMNDMPGMRVAAERVWTSEGIDAAWDTWDYAVLLTAELNAEAIRGD